MFKTFFSGKLQQGMIVLVFTLSAFVGYLKFENINLENSVLEGEISLTDMTNEYNKCDNKLTKLNEKILVAKKNSERYQESIDELKINVAKSEGENSVLIGMLRNDVAPKVCSEFGNYLRDGLEKIKW